MFDLPTTGWSKRRLARWLAVFWLALVIPTAVLTYQAYSQLKWEAFHRYRLMAEELVASIDRRLTTLIGIEGARSFADYSFLVVTGDVSGNVRQRSPLSAFPVAGGIPGLVGYFQVDPAGRFTTPLLPESGADAAGYGLSDQELAQRRGLRDRIANVLRENQLVQAGRAEVRGGMRTAPEPKAIRRDQVTDERDAVAALRSAATTEAESTAAQSAFDRLNEVPAREETVRKKTAQTLGRVEDLKLESRFGAATPADSARSLPQAQAPAPIQAKRALRKERVVISEQSREFHDGPRGTAPAAPPAMRIRIFEGEVDSFEMGRLDSGHFVLFRKVWRDGQRYIQGALVDSGVFFRDMVAAPFRATALPGISDIALAHRDDVLAAVGGRAEPEYLASTDELRGALLYRAHFSGPFRDLEAIFSLRSLPVGKTGAIVAWVAAITLIVLCVGFLLMFRLGARQIDLARQQQDFISAVSHELKTPLTSIRMYGEILQEGWADEQKKNDYYGYIHDEGERLSRLIDNVLQLARMTRNELAANLKPLTLDTLLESVRTRVIHQVERAGFVLDLDCPEAPRQTTVNVDADYFIQIVINLVDNALKFAARARNKTIDIKCRALSDGQIQISVRDYGPGIPRDQMKKIFKLFYRSENELTRETAGTGIGLALVQQLATAMNGRIDVVNQEPGAEFRLFLPAMVSA